MTVYTQPEIITETGEIVKTDDAWERHKRIVGYRNLAEKTFLALGEELYHFEDLKQYTDLGHPTFESYLADPDVDIARRTAFVIKGIYKKYVMELQSASDALLPVGYNKLEVMRPHMIENNVDEWVIKAATLSRSDLKIEIDKAFPPPPPPPLPEGEFRVIYADPPWQFDNSGFDQSAASHYSTMSTEDICKLEIPAGDHSVLLMWATNAMLEDALEVIKAWGFNYKTNMVWIKDKGPSIGWFITSRHEHLLIATRGEGMHPDYKPLSVITGEVTKHSKKPNSVYELIERMYEGPYLELFARNKRDGWESWGNEI